MIVPVVPCHNAGPKLAFNDYISINERIYYQRLSGIRAIVTVKIDRAPARVLKIILSYDVIGHPAVTVYIAQID